MWIWLFYAAQRGSLDCAISDEPVALDLPWFVFGAQVKYYFLDYSKTAGIQAQDATLIIRSSQPAEFPSVLDQYGDLQS